MFIDFHKKTKKKSTTKKFNFKKKHVFKIILITKSLLNDIKIQHGVCLVFYVYIKRVVQHIGQKTKIK